MMYFSTTLQSLIPLFPSHSKSQSFKAQLQTESILVSAEFGSVPSIQFAMLFILLS
jgi:hypothetical protein